MATRLRAAILVALAASMLAILPATAAPGNKVLDASMTGIPVAGQVLLGQQGGGVPWVLDKGDAKLWADGTLEVTVRGLVLATTGVNPVATGIATVVCGGGTASASSAAVPFSPTGDAVVEAKLTLPDPCLAPVVFFSGVTGNGPRWFAVTGS